MKNKLSFDEFYYNIYQERWNQLKDALLSNTHVQISYINNFADSQKYLNHTDQINDLLPNCILSKPQEEIPRSPNGLLDYYILDPASVICAEMLMVKPGHKVLDVCAAPGGKSLILIQRLLSSENSDSEIILNELSKPRRERLIKVIQQYIPKEVRSNLWVKGQEGALFCFKNQNKFDCILLDAPCSGEKHLLANKKELENWLPKRSEKLAQQQYSLLSGALLALKQGGEMIYSTCSISNLENDLVIEKLKKKKADQFDTANKDDLYKILQNFLTQSQISDWVEFTKYGIQFLPDKCNFGPLYISKLYKKHD